MSLASATNSFFTMWPLMSRPRMFCAWVNASSGVAAYFTPPALPRPPVFTCALTMTGRPISVAMALAPSAVSVTRPGVLGTLCLANSSFAWYSKRSMNSLSLCVDVEGLRPTGQGELYPHGITRSPSPTSHVVDVTARRHVIQVTIHGGIPSRVATNIGIWLTCLWSRSRFGHDEKDIPGWLGIVRLIPDR